MFFSDNDVFQVCSQLKMMKDDDWSSRETGLNGEMKCFGMDITVCGKKHVFTYISTFSRWPLIKCHLETVLQAVTAFYLRTVYLPVGL